MRPRTAIALGLCARGYAIGCALGCALGCAIGCSAAAPSPYFGDERFLVVGVSPDAEADALVTKLATLGQHERIRLRGSKFTALGIDDAQGVPALVRVITARGIALALDPAESNLLDRGARYELLPTATPGLFDADGDGFDELLVMQSTYDRADACLLAYRVQSSGFVDPIDDASTVTALGRQAGSSATSCAVDSSDAGVLSPAPHG